MAWAARIARWRSAWRSGGTPGRTVGLAVVAVGLVGALLLGFWSTRGPEVEPLTRADVDQAGAGAIERARQEQREIPPDAAQAYRRVAPSVVTVRHGDQLGAGVVVSDQGAIFTALHVVSGPGDVEVTFADGTTTQADISTRQAENDIAVLTPRRLPGVLVPAVLGGGVQVGDAVFPVGNPFGLEDSLSAGVVSALDRQIRTGAGTLEGLIQFDAAVNPGNSGGPLLDRSGAVVGVVTALANPSEEPFFIGIGFAVPIRTAGGGANGPST